MVNKRRDQEESVPPGQLPNVPPDLPGTAQTRLLIQTIEDNLKDVKGDIKDIKKYRHSDFVYMIAMLAGGFVLLAGMLIATYFIIDSKFEKLSEKVDRLSISSTRVDVKLEDLLARIPPVQTPVPQAPIPQK